MNGWDVMAVVVMLFAATSFGWCLRSACEGETKNSPRAGAAFLAILMCVICVQLVRMHPPLSDLYFFPYALAAPCALGYWFHKKRTERRHPPEASAPETSNGAIR